NFAESAPVLVFDGVESFSQVAIDFDLHLLGESAEFCKCFGVEGPESAQVDQMADYKVERAIELEQGLINLQPIPAGKMGVSHDAPQMCVLVRAASVFRALAWPAVLLSQKPGANARRK